MLARNLPVETSEEPSRLIILALTMAVIGLMALAIWVSQPRLNEYNSYMMSMYGQESK